MGNSSNGYLIVDRITKNFGKTRAVDAVSFSVGKGEMVTLLGPSGCGKSTTLRCVAGLESIDGGEIVMDGQIVSSASRNTAPVSRTARSTSESASIAANR